MKLNFTNPIQPHPIYLEIPYPFISIWINNHNQLKNEGKIEIGLTESDVLYILGEYSEVREETSQNKKKKRLWYDYTDGYLVVYLTEGIVSSFNREKR